MEVNEKIKRAWTILDEIGAMEKDRLTGFWKIKLSVRYEFILLHNELFPEQKESPSCAPCIMRAISRFQHKYFLSVPEEIKNKYPNFFNKPLP